MSARPLTDTEYELVKSQFTNSRDRLIFVLGYRTGFRITEILSLTIQDVLSNTIKVSRKNMKGKLVSREVAKHKEIQELVTLYLVDLGQYEVSAPLFKSCKRDGPITRQMAHIILKQAYNDAGLSGNGLSTHTMRKSWAKNIYKKSGNNLVLLQKAIGHANIGTTVKYLNVFQDEIDALILE